MILRIEIDPKNPPWGWKGPLENILGGLGSTWAKKVCRSLPAAGKLEFTDLQLRELGLIDLQLRELELIDLR